MTTLRPLFTLLECDRYLNFQPLFIFKYGLLYHELRLKFTRVVFYLPSKVIAAVIMLRSSLQCFSLTMELPVQTGNTRALSTECLAEMVLESASNSAEQRPIEKPRYTIEERLEAHIQYTMPNFRTFSFTSFITRSDDYTRFLINVSCIDCFSFQEDTEKKCK